MAVAVHAREPRFLFFWNHKVASRTLVHGLRSAFPALRIYPQPAFRPPLDDREWPRFLIVRDPWARVVSCYRNKCLDAPQGLARNGHLEPCQRHLLRRLGIPNTPAEEAAKRLAGLPFETFVDALDRVRDGNSHFRLQIDLLTDAGAVRNPVIWGLRAGRCLAYLGRTHYRTPLLLSPARASLDAHRVRAARRADIDLIRLEELDDGWAHVEEVLERKVPLDWHARTSDRGDWRVMYDENTRDRVGRIYEPDAEVLGYAPPQLPAG